MTILTVFWTTFNANLPSPRYRVSRRAHADTEMRAHRTGERRASRSSRSDAGTSPGDARCVQQQQPQSTVRSPQAGVTPGPPRLPQRARKQTCPGKAAGPCHRRKPVTQPPGPVRCRLRRAPPPAPGAFFLLVERSCAGCCPVAAPSSTALRAQLRGGHPDPTHALGAMASPARCPSAPRGRRRASAASKGSDSAPPGGR